MSIQNFKVRGKFSKLTFSQGANTTRENSSTQKENSWLAEKQIAAVSFNDHDMHNAWRFVKANGKKTTVHE
jgi:hypothetical protein